MLSTEQMTSWVGLFASLKHQQKVMLKGLGQKYLNCTEQERLSFRHSLQYLMYEELLVTAWNKNL